MLNRTGRLRTLWTSTAAIALLVTLGACASDPLTDSVRRGRTEAGDRESRVSAMLRVAGSTAATGDVATAAGIYRRAHDIEPENIPALLGLARSFAALGANDEAVAAYRAVLDIDPVQTDALRGLAGIYIAVDQPRTAIDHLEAALEQGEDARLYNALGLAHDMQGDHKAAQACYRTGISVEPGNLSLRNNLGLSLAVSGEHREAIEVLRQAAAMPGAGSRQRLNLAIAYGLAGETETAMEIARQDLDEQSVRSNVAFYRMLRGLNDSRAAMRAIGSYLAGATATAETPQPRRR